MIYGTLQGFYTTRILHSHDPQIQLVEKCDFKDCLLFRYEILLKPHPAADNIFEDLNCSLYFVAGNHEDHQYIEHIRYNMARDQAAPIAVDVDWDGISDGKYNDDDSCGYERIFCMPEVPIVSLDGPLSTETWEPEYHLNIRAINGFEKYTNRPAWEAPKPGTVDILLSHETPKGRLKGYDATGRRDSFGSEKLEEFLKRLSPSWHFFGHYYGYYPEATINSGTFDSIRSVGMNQLFFDRNSSKISSGSFGILTTSISQKTRKLELEFSIVDDPWFEYIYRNHVIHVL